jgi:hypothetical protein
MDLYITIYVDASRVGEATSVTLSSSKCAHAPVTGLGANDV